jgi:hypothetical protein
VCGLAIVIGLLSGTDGSNSSRLLPGFAFSDGADPSQAVPALDSFDPIAGLVAPARGNGQEKGQKTDTAAQPWNRSKAVDQRASDDNQSTARAPDRSGSEQPRNAGGRPASSSPGPRTLQAPSVTLPHAPSANPPTLPQAPSVSPPPPPDTSGSVSASPPAASVSASPPAVSVSASPPAASVSASPPAEAAPIRADVSVSARLP